MLTQEALAFKCKVSVRTVVAWETGEKLPTSRNQARLAKALGVEINDLSLWSHNEAHRETV